MNNYALEVNGLCKKFRRGELHDSLRDLIPAVTRSLFSRAPKQELDRSEFWALKDVSFSVKQGEAFGVIGSNGAGKSTILKLLTGIMQPTRGSVRLAGRISALIEVGAGFHPDLTGRENIYLNGTILGMTRQEIRARFDAIVAFSGLEEFIDTPVKRYSSGMYARLGFSVAAHVDPDVLIVDEVLSVGDYIFQKKCVDRMNAVIASGATVIFVSHNLRALAELCQRSLLLERGQVKMVGPTNDVVDAYYTSGQEQRKVDLDRELLITKVSVYGDSGARVQYESGSKLYITVEARAARRHQDLTVVIAILDERYYLLFETCTHLLGQAPITLDAGQTIRCTFELDLALAQGRFRVNASLLHAVNGTVYDHWPSAFTFFVIGTPELHGIAALRPKLNECHVGEAGSSETLPHPQKRSVVSCDNLALLSDVHGGPSYAK